MRDERALRRPTFAEGRRLTLADGQTWSLPERPADHDDPKYDAMLRMIGEAEDEADRLRSELALSIFLLARNYELTPEAFQVLLDFAPGDPAQAQMQRDVHALAVEQIRRVPWAGSAPEAEEPEPLSCSWKMLARVRALWSLRHN